jgi:arylsulfatase A-like enzyme
VLLVSLDTTRADRLSIGGGPNATSPSLARLAAEGVTFTRAYSPGNESLYAHAALFTGRWPSEVAPPSYAAYTLPAGTPTLASVLSAYGYRTAAFTGGGHVVEDFGFQHGFQSFRAVPLGTFGSLYDSVPPARAWITTHPDAPWFAFVHGYDAHAPYVAPEPFTHLFTGQGRPLMERLVADPVAIEQVRGRRWFADRTPRDFQHASGRAILDPSLYTQPAAPRRGERVETLTDDDVAHLKAHYDASLVYQDLWLGRLLSGVDLTRTVVVVVGDHGEDLLDHGFVNHRAGLWDSTTHVPLVVAGPGVPKGLRVDSLVDLRDVVPTVLAAVGATPPAGLHGADLVALAGGRGTPRDAVYAEGILDMASIRTETRRLVVRGVPLGAGSALRLADLPLDAAHFDLYDLQTDPGETRDLLEQATPIVRASAAELRARMVAWREGLHVPAAAAGPLVPGKLAEELKAKGYWTPDAPGAAPEPSEGARSPSR